MVLFYSYGQCLRDDCTLGIVIPIDWERTTRPLLNFTTVSDHYAIANMTPSPYTPPTSNVGYTFDYFVRGSSNTDAPWSTPLSALAESPDFYASLPVGGNSIPSGWCEVTEVTVGQYAQYDITFLGMVMMVVNLNLYPTETWKATASGQPDTFFTRDGHVITSFSYRTYQFNLAEEGGGEGGGEEEP